jgi:hypothetical protein
MERIIYVGPDLIFKFLRNTEEPTGHFYHAIIKAGSIKLCAVVQFEKLQAKYKDSLGPVECSMGISISSVAGPPASIEAMNKALHIITVNSKQAGEVCCQAFLNEFLDAEF